MRVRTATREALVDFAGLSFLVRYRLRRGVLIPGAAADIIYVSHKVADGAAGKTRFERPDELRSLRKATSAYGEPLPESLAGRVFDLIYIN